MTPEPDSDLLHLHVLRWVAPASRRL